jgi:hypothetical protein
MGKNSHAVCCFWVQGDLAFEDLDRLMPDDAAHIVEWLTEKVDALSSKLKAEPRDEEEVR